MGYKKISQCRACSSPHLFSYLYLGEVPLANNLGSTDKFPIEVFVCEDCYLSQLSVVVDPKILYSQYAYHSSISETFKKHCVELGNVLLGMFHRNPKPEWFHGSEEKWTQKRVPRILDIAANDGCLLREFKKLGFTCIGVDPATNLGTNPSSPSDIGNINEWVPILNEFWSEEVAKNIDYSRIRPWGDSDGARMDFIVAQNVLGHVDDLCDFLKGVHFALEPDGVFVVEVPYMVDLVERNEFDTIYHEHLSYFLLNPLYNLFASLGLPIFKVERIPIHGGSLRIYASKGFREKDDSVGDMLILENSLGFYGIKKYVDFATNVYDSATHIINVLDDLTDHGMKIMGYGASAKGISLINYFGLGRFIHSIVDDTPDKQGKRTPGSDVPIVDFSHFEREKPDYILLLAWNFSDELMAKTKHLGAK